MAPQKPAPADEQQPKKGSSLFKIIIMVVLLLVMGVGGYIGWTKFFRNQSEAAPEPEKAVKTLYEMDTFLVNLADPGGKRYLKVTMKLGLSNPLVTPEITEMNYKLRDTVLTLLANKEFEDIATFAGKTALKHEIITQLNKDLVRGRVEDVYFTEFLVQ